MAVYKGSEKLGVTVFNNKPMGTEYNGSTEITPGTSDVTIEKGKYLGSEVTVKGDSNLVPGNIVSGKEIFGVQGTMSGGFPNGTEWTESNVTSGSFNSIYNANGIWVAGSDSGLYYSTNGKTWTQSNITSGYFNPVYYANGIWVSVGGGLYYSTNGKTWTQSNITSGGFASIYNANGIWVAVGKGIYYSNDGKTWTQSNRTNEDFYSLYYADGLWNAGGGIADITTETESIGLYYSYDGINWYEGIRKFSMETLYNANGLWIVAGNSGEGIYYSTDGISWMQSNITSESFYSFYNANGIWVGNAGYGGLYYSIDGISWTQSNITSGYSCDIYNANGIWVADTYYSTDGKTWTQSNITNSIDCTYNANGIWVGGSSGLYYSVSWEPDPPLIGFWIDNTMYQAEEGMTWEQWISSNYNTDGYKIDNTDRITDNEGNGILATKEGQVLITSEIIVNSTYYLITDGPVAPPA